MNIVMYILKGGMTKKTDNNQKIFEKQISDTWLYLLIPLQKKTDKKTLKIKHNWIA